MWFGKDINSALLANPHYRKIVGTYTASSTKADKEAKEAGVK